jgi:hypothetical protein
LELADVSWWASRRHRLIAAQAVVVLALSIAAYFGFLRPGGTGKLTGVTAPGGTYRRQPALAPNRHPGRHRAGAKGHHRGPGGGGRRHGAAAGAATATTGGGRATAAGAAATTAGAAGGPAATVPPPVKGQYSNEVAALAARLGTAGAGPP